MNRLKELREEALLTVRELSERSGLSEDTITKIENGHRKGRGTTLRKLAKALGVSLEELSPEHFEVSREDSAVPKVLQDTHILDEAISRVYEVMRAIDQPVEKSSPQRGYHDGVPRMNITERQQNVLIMVLECGEVGPSTVADLLGLRISAAYMDLSVLEEHGLVMADESGKRRISPLGRDLVEAIIHSRTYLFGRDVGESIVKARGRLSLDEALSQILALMKVYDSVAEFDPYRATDEDAASFFRLQELVNQSIRRIVALTEPARLANQMQQNLGGGGTELKGAVDYARAAQAVQTVMRVLMPNPPALARIREDLEGSTEEQIREALNLVVTISPIDYDNYGPSNPYKQFHSLLGLRVESPIFPYDTVQRDETEMVRT